MTFKEYIAQNLHNKDITKLEKLYCRNSGLEDLEGIEKFINLKELYAADNQISNISSLPPKLKLLEVASNKLIKLPELPKSLEYLYCSLNRHLVRLPELPVKLKTLHCTNTDIKTIDKIPLKLELLIVGENRFLKEIKEFDMSINILGFNITNTPLEKKYGSRSIDVKLGINLTKDSEERGKAALMHSGLFDFNIK